MNFNGNPYTVPAIVLLAAMLLGGILWLAWAGIRKDLDPAYQPEHTRRAVRARLRAESAGFADPADATDPDGQEYVGELHYDAGDADWWDEPPPGTVVSYDHPGWEPPPSLGGYDNSPAAAARLRDALMALPLADMTPAADEDEPQLDDTGQLPAAVCTWGMTAPELADELAARYLAAPHG